MVYLFIASFALVIYGTLFPFNFQADAHTGGLLQAFAESLFVRPGRGDLMSNVVLFLPFGFFGMQALPIRLPTVIKYILTFGLGAVVSLGIEIAQYYTLTRTTSLYDLGLNSISALVGAAGGRFDWQRLVGGVVTGVRPRSIFPLIVIATWAGYRLFP
jgi:glycopeptide antibiotics resistance protein